MKRRRMRLNRLCCVLLAALSLLLAACGGAGDEVTPPETTAAPETTVAPAEAGLEIVVGGKSDYQIVRPDEAGKPLVDAVIALKNAIKASTGAELTLGTDFEIEQIPSTHAKTYEIVVGNTTRNGKYFTYDVESMGSYDFTITVADRRVLILGRTEAAAIDGVAYFIEHCLPEQGDFVFDPTTHILQTREPSEKLSVMSLNLLATDTEYNSKDHMIGRRISRVNTVITDHLPDSIGLQECSATWRNYFDGMDTRWSYDRVGADKNEKISILYNKDTLEVVESGSIWLTEQPESLKISVEWESTTERLAHYAVFRVKASGAHYVHVNTHIGFDNKTIALEQAKVVRDYCESLHAKTGYPVVCTGDFNFDRTTDYYKAYVDGLMADTRDLAVESAEGTGTFNKLGAAGYPKAHAIDQVMVSEGEWDVYTYAVDYRTFEGKFYSDHYAVVATMSLRGK